MRRARHPARRPQRPGRRQHAGQAVRPDRRPVPAGRAHRRGQPERQLRVQLPQLRPGHRRRHQPGRVGRATPPPSRSPTTSTTTPPTRRPPSGWPTSRASPTAAACSTAWPRRPPASRSCSSRAGRPRAAPAPRPATPAPWPPTTRSSTASAGPPASPAPPRSRRRSRRRRRSPPSPRRPGPNVVVLTTAGGWGVVTSDAIARDGDLRLLALPDDLRDAIDGLLPPRWSRNNPVDCAGGETRDTIPDVMRLIAEHPDVHAIVYLGLGIQSNQARMMRDGRFFPGYGLDRIVAYHERQDARFAEAADELSRATGKPILTATELAVADPDNAGPAAVRASGRLCYPSGNRAVTALGHLYRDARHRSRRAAVSPRSPAGGQPDRRAVRPRPGPGGDPVRAVAVGGGRGRRGRRAAADERAGRPAGAVAGPDHAAAVVPSGPGGARPRRQPARRSRARSPTFGATLDAPSCVSVAVDGDPRRLDAGRPAADPGQQQKLLVGAVALEVLGADHTYTTEVRARGARRRRRRRRPLPRRRRRPAADQLDVSGRQRPQPGHDPDVARRARRRGRGRRRAAHRRRRDRRRQPLRRRVLRARAGSTTSAASRPARTTPCSSTTPASPATRCGRPTRPWPRRAS